MLAAPTTEDTPFDTDTLAYRLNNMFFSYIIFGAKIIQ
jgi:hypothetical protein